ncbi:uncharacterized protein Dwil_GK13823 [Drosophila willistoni]|uniref:Uncharacterized protein n=1 Tax=Drosophila willistoni TaxID=7260 RepID=B4NJ39_DROWI|nr:uncharacterized protein Dwil_GK13823 [Drosophila willistoni]
MQVPIPLRRNIVAIVSDRFRMNIRALTILEDICPYVPPPHVFDVTHLLNYFIKESDISCENNVLLLVDTVFKRQEYRNQLNEIQQRCKSINYDTLALFWAFISSIKETLKNIFQVIDKDEFVLTKLNSDRMEQKGKSFVRHMPVMPLKMCAEGGGLLSFMVYDAAMESANLLTSYLPAAMQALAYYIDLLQYEPLATTTVEPPFSVSTTTALDKREESESTTSRPTQATTTRRPTGSGWWQPPSWWETPQRTSTTTARPTSAPTPPHRPALFAPPAGQLSSSSPILEGHALFNEIGDDDSDIDRLPLSLIRDIQSEALHDDFTNDVESLDNFLRLYDDNYGRAAFDFDLAMDRLSSDSTAGKKRVPPTKPYVDFLLVYDLLKRDAKAANLSKYEGYSEDLLQQLYEISNSSSSARQLHTIFQRMLDRGDVQRSDVVARIQGIVKDLGNPNSPTSKALAYIPTMQFLP